MSEMAKIQQIGETDAREVINRWSAGGYFRIRNFGDKIFLQEIATTASYHLRLRTHYEERSVEQAQKPYHGGPIDDDGHPPGIWDIHVERPREFEERQEVLPLPHTERVQLCPQCAGVGRVGCAKCLGSGKTTCPFCTGAGFLQRQEMVPGGGTNNQGGAVDAHGTDSLHLPERSGALHGVRGQRSNHLLDLFGCGEDHDVRAD